MTNHNGKMIIYDYDNRKREVNLPNKRITMLDVVILSGDEVVTVYFEDDTNITADSSYSRIHDFYDGGYIVRGEQIEEWLKYKPDKKVGTISYDRQEKFYN